MLKIRFKDENFVFTGDSLEDGGAVAKQDDYESGRCSFAHLYVDGNIMRFGERIGTIADIKVIGKCDLKPNKDAIFNLLTDSSWVIDRC